MKSIIFCFGVILVCVSCRKDPPSIQPRLVQFKDSLNVFNLEYNHNNQVTALWLDSTGWWQNYTAVPPTKYVSFSYANNYVKAAYPTGPGWLNVYTEFNLNASKLPVSILTHQDVNGIDSIVKRTTFYYQLNSTVLDSVISRNPDDSYFFKYTPQYSNGNIIQYAFTALPSGITAQVQFTYSSKPNAYRATDPYMFIYVNPGFVEDVAWLPTVFSNNSVQSITAYGASKVVTQTTNVNNQLIFEDWNGFHPYQRLFIYQ